MAWLSLDPGDDDLVPFLRYLVAACQTLLPSAGSTVVARLQGRHTEGAPDRRLRTLALAEPLTTRECEVLRLIAAGKSNGEIAAALVVAVSTVKAHINSIFGKLGATSRTQALVRAHELDLL